MESNAATNVSRIFRFDPDDTSDQDAPVFVLVHGAFADGSVWDAVASQLRSDHYPVIVAAIALRGLAHDSAALRALLENIECHVILVGHSYAGSLISEVGCALNVKALVFVSALAPDASESARDLLDKFPGSQLGDALIPVAGSHGGAEMYVRADRFRDVLARDVDSRTADAMAMSQRPVDQGAFTAASGPPAWRDRPNWFVYGDADASMPPDLHAFMARRAGSAETTVVPGGSHSLMVSHPDEVVEVLKKAAAAVTLVIPNPDP
jgi:pimeloyl-ACP methyl ester carboxylesterase